MVRYTNNEVYLTRYASITIPGGGIYGFSPGTKFIIDPTRHSLPDKVFVTDGVHQLAIEPDALTRNPERARALASSDQQGQAMSAAAVQAAKSHVSQVERDAQLSRAHDVELMNARQRLGGTPVPPKPVPTPVPRAVPSTR